MNRPAIAPGSGFERVQQASARKLRVESFVDLASVVADGFSRWAIAESSVIDLLIDLETQDYRPSHASCAALAAWVGSCEASCGEYSDYYEQLAAGLIQRALVGVVVRFATAVREFEAPDAVPSCSWDRVHTTWIYAATYEEAWALGLQWVETCEIHDREATR